MPPMNSSSCHAGALVTAILVVLALVVTAPAEISTTIQLNEPAKTVLGSLMQR